MHQKKNYTDCIKYTVCTIYCTESIRDIHGGQCYYCYIRINSTGHALYQRADIPETTWQSTRCFLTWKSNHYKCMHSFDCLEQRGTNRSLISAHTQTHSEAGITDHSQSLCHANSHRPQIWPRRKYVNILITLLSHCISA